MSGIGTPVRQARLSPTQLAVREREAALVQFIGNKRTWGEIVAAFPQYTRIQLLSTLDALIAEGVFTRSGKSDKAEYVKCS